MVHVSNKQQETIRGEHLCQEVNNKSVWHTPYWNLRTCSSKEDSVTIET